MLTRSTATSASKAVDPASVCEAKLDKLIMDSYSAFRDLPDEERGAFREVMQRLCNVRDQLV
jgi:hypothetical protein